MAVCVGGGCGWRVTEGSVVEVVKFEEIVEVGIEKMVKKIVEIGVVVAT